MKERVFFRGNLSALTKNFPAQSIEVNNKDKKQIKKALLLVIVTITNNAFVSSNVIF